MPDPIRSLKVLRQWLSETGIIFVEVPNIEREADEKLRGWLFHYGHIFNFNPYMFRLAASLAGLEELPASKERFAQMTAGFFRKAAAAGAVGGGAGENARHMKATLEANAGRIVPRPRESTALGRFIKTIAARLGEIIATARFRDHRAIARHFVMRVSAPSAGER